MKATIPLKGIATQTKPAFAGSKTHIACEGRLCCYSPRLIACSRSVRSAQGFLPNWDAPINRVSTPYSALSQSANSFRKMLGNKRQNFAAFCVCFAFCKYY